VIALISLVPAPHRIRSEGVVWLPEEAHVRAGADGFVREVLVRPGTHVDVGAALVETYEPVIASRIAVMQARIEELEAKLDAERFTERVQADLTREELARDAAAYERITQRSAALIARSAVNGVFMIAEPDDLDGRFVKQGQLIGYVTQEAKRIV